MVRKYKKNLGTRHYKNYTSETLSECLNAVKSGMRIKDASEKFGIHRNTISNKMHKKILELQVNDFL